MAGQKDLQLLIGEMNPRHNPGEYVYCSVPGSINFNEEQVLFTFKEEEGLSVILKKEYADELGVEYDFVASWITLTVHSALDAVGLTAAFS
ncbi:MAG: ACT domain-containing protein, partial [Flavitalea sp.]